MKVDKCISCGSPDGVVAGHSGEIIERHGEAVFKQLPYSVIKCGVCGLYYKDEVLDKELINSYYNSIDSSIWISKTAYPTEIITERYIRSVHKPGARIFDYGCSQGRFLERFLNEYDCFGYDIDVSASQIARSKGIKMLDAINGEKHKSSFDVVILSDVIEHSLSPTELVVQLFSLLKDGGILCISTGYGDAKLVQYDMANYWYLRSIQHFSMVSNSYVMYLAGVLHAEISFRKICSHYSDTFFTRIRETTTFWLKFFLFRNVARRQSAWWVSLLKSLPLVSRVSKWNIQPYFMFAQDHIVFVLRKNEL